MSALCDALVTLGLAFGGICSGAQETAVPALPEDEKRMWAAAPAKPAPEPNIPAFPPVIIKQAAPVVAPAEPPPAEPSVVFAAPPPLPPSPVRLALEAAFSGSALKIGIESVEGEQVTPPGMLTPARFTPSGDAAVPPVTIRKPYDAPGVTSGLPVDNTRILTADRYISGILETGLNSQLDSAAGGQAIIQTSRDVYGYHGRSALVPKGSRLICNYQSPSRQGDTRIAFTCSRILLGEHRAEILQLSATAGDVQGRSGVPGEVDNRFWERYGTAFLLTGVSAAVRFATALSSSSLSSSDSQDSSLGQVADNGSEELSQKLGEITASVLEQTVNIAPIVTIAQGTRVQIRPAKDWYIRITGEDQ